MRLRLDKNPNPSAVDLDWSGSVDTFQLFRSTSPLNLTDPGNLHLATPLCFASDTESGSGILFYKVLPLP